MTEKVEPKQDDELLENWFLLMDPGWKPESEEDQPPVEAIVGLWPVEEGRVGKFRPNPSYIPSDETSPTDPLDAVLRLVMRGEAEAEHIQLMLRDTLFDIAVDEDGSPLVRDSPDDIPCVVIATGEPHRLRISSPDWRRIDLAALVGLLTDGVDVLFNPGGPAAVRLNASFMRLSLDLDDEVVARLYAEQRDSVEVVPTFDKPGAVQE
ncbi:type VII secretion system-associated protein [Amycolatopsis thailandensis]|uniref:type VII secretion system-associated protein n=1 Tax=Amycolatopsis thailandensis TaxID=589330 RepID=UPI003640996B